MLLKEFDGEKNAVINPEMLVSPIEDFPPVTVSCFSAHLFESVLACFDARKIAGIRSAGGENPVYEVTYKGTRFALFCSRVGEPACIGDYEDLMAMGSRRLILTGSCGVLDGSIEDCGIIIPTAAIRDEGASYHYAPPSDLIEVNKRYRSAFKEVLAEHGYSFAEGVTWTTDAPYRETREKANRRKAQGAICVEMECAGMQALADFRDSVFFQFFYAGDNLDSAEWDPRSLPGLARLDDKTKILFLAFELGLKMLHANDGDPMKLVEPSAAYADQIRSYRQEFLDAGDSMDGTCSLRKYESAEDWVNWTRRIRDPDTCPPDRVPDTQFLFVRESDGVIVGMLDVRHNLEKEDLKRFYGHIGYSVRPSERRKGYAKRMLREALSVCPDIGLEEVLITCNDGNEASRRTILANGGVFDGTVFEPHDGVCIHRYRIRTIAGSDPAV